MIIIIIRFTCFNFIIIDYRNTFFALQKQWYSE